MSQTATPEGTRALLSPTDAARLANVSRKTVYREINRGALPALHVGRQLRIDLDDSPLSRPRGPAVSADPQTNPNAGILAQLAAKAERHARMVDVLFGVQPSGPDAEGEHTKP